MNTLYKILGAVAAVSAGLATTGAAAPAPTRQLPDTTVGEAPPTTDWTDSTSSVQLFADPETVVGESTLRRTADGVYAAYTAADVGADYAVTLWWIVFNQPDNCSAPGCGPDDVFVDGDPAAGLDPEAIAATDAVGSYGAGTLTSPEGWFSMSARLAEGDSGVDVIFGDGAVLKDAERAEIHLVTRSHGPAIAGLEVVQTTSYGGGCESMLLPPEIADAEGECVDLQFSMHRPGE